MRRVLAAAWLAVVVAAAVYLTVLGIAGFPIRTDLLALLPREERDPVVQQANEAVSRSLGRRLLLAFGDSDRARARAAARQATAAIAATGLVDPLDGAALQDAGRRLATFYFPYRDALLSAAIARPSRTAVPATSPSAPLPRLSASPARSMLEPDRGRSVPAAAVVPVDAAEPARTPRPRRRPV